MIISEETKILLKILLALPLLIIILNKIRLLNLEEKAKTKQLLFKQRDWIINRHRRYKKGVRKTVK